jgi:hypothetical protein
MVYQLTLQRPKLQTALLKYFLHEDYNFEQLNVLGGTTVGGSSFLDIGTVVGQVVNGAVTVSAAIGDPEAPANTGNGTVALGSPAYQGLPQAGNYSVVFTSATEFEVFDPIGHLVGTGKNGTAFAGGQIVFTVTAGGTAFVAGDSFVIPVAIAAGGMQVEPLNQTSAVTSAATASSSAVLHFSGGVPANVVVGMQVADPTTPGVITPGTTVQSLTSTTVTMSANAIGTGVASGDTIAFMAADGSQKVYGVISSGVTVNATDTPAALLVRGPAILLSDGIIWPVGISAAQQAAAIAQLAALNIIIHNG